MTTTDDLFAGCELDEIFALVFDQAGADGLQSLLAKVDLDRETLIDTADKIETAGLLEAAKLVAGAAARAADPLASEITAILNDSTPGNRRALLAAMYRHDRANVDDLIAAGVDDDTLDYVGRSRAQTRVRACTHKN